MTGHEPPRIGVLAPDLVATSPESADEYDVVLCERRSEGDLSTPCVAVDDVDAAAADIERSIDRNPLAAAILAEALRRTDQLDVQAALVAESLAYSTLLAGPEFAGWLDSRDRRVVPEDPADVVIVERVEDELRITLNRPGRHNAYNRVLRDQLCDALDIGLLDDSVTSVLVRGAGPSFCSGGDLDEFGTTPDVVTAHLVRTTRSAGHRLHQLGDKVTVEVHGACIGAGVELPAFAGRVIAAPDARFALPELSMGLIPGAGGTVSLPRRIGRWRTAWLALTGAAIDADTALRWGLVDETHRLPAAGTMPA